MGLKITVFLLFFSVGFLFQMPISAHADCNAVDITADIDILGTATTGEQACSNAKRLCETRGANEAAGSAAERCSEACQAQGIACTFTIATPGDGTCTLTPPGSFALAGQYGCYYAGSFTVNCGCTLQ